LTSYTSKCWYVKAFSLQGNISGKLFLTCLSPSGTASLAAAPAIDFFAVVLTTSAAAFSPASCAAF
jgi:hypothetical protein